MELRAVTRGDERDLDRDHGKRLQRLAQRSRRACNHSGPRAVYNDACEWLALLSNNLSDDLDRRQGSRGD